MGSLVWSHFEKIHKGISKCKFCGDKLTTKSGNTSVLRKHLKRHPSEFSKLLEAEHERNSTVAAALPSKIMV